MFAAQLLRPRLICIIVLAFVLIGGAYGFAATNIVATSMAGSGSASISGYVITNISYTMDGTDPSLISAINIKLYIAGGSTPASDTTHAQVQFYDGSSATVGDIYTCQVSTSIPDWSCTTSGTMAALSTVERLRVDAHD